MPCEGVLKVVNQEAFWLDGINVLYRKTNKIIRG